MCWFGVLFKSSLLVISNYRELWYVTSHVRIQVNGHPYVSGPVRVYVELCLITVLNHRMSTVMAYVMLTTLMIKMCFC